MEEQINEKKEVLIKVEGVSKKFSKNLKRSLWYGLKDIASSLTGSEVSDELRKDEFWAVRDISFEVRRGECLGLIGHNGAGKSTLLKMLNGLILPDEGRIEMRGKIGALIELGAGFNSLLTGRENVYTNGAVLGFTREEIERKFDDIVAFAELEEFIDTPVQNYSSGMKVRLGFAVAVIMEPDVLIIDEVLAVGDANFIIKSYNRINELIKKCAVVFVSHNMPQVAKLVSKVIYLEHGVTIDYSSNKNKIISNYLSKQTNVEAYRVIAGENISYFNVFNRGSNVLNSRIEIDYMSDLIVSLNFNFKALIPKYSSIVVKFFDVELRPCGVFQSNRFSDLQLENSIVIKMEKINLSPGPYSVTIWLLSHDDLESENEIIQLGIEAALKVFLIGESISNFAFSRYQGAVSRSS